MRRKEKENEMGKEKGRTQDSLEVRTEGPTYKQGYKKRENTKWT